MTDDSQKKHFRRTHFPDRFMVVLPRVKDERLKICDGCAYFNRHKHCDINGKFVPSYALSKAASCPLGQWSANYDNS